MNDIDFEVFRTATQVLVGDITLAIKESQKKTNGVLPDGTPIAAPQQIAHALAALLGATLGTLPVETKIPATKEVLVTLSAHAFVDLTECIAVAPPKKGDIH